MNNLLDIMTAPWAITPSMLAEIREIYVTHLHGEKIDIPDIEAKLGRTLDNQTKAGYDLIDGVAVIDITGVIGQRMNMFTKISGGASTDMLTRQFGSALADPAVHSIVLHIDSPGGMVFGTPELAEAIFKARDIKPVITFTDAMMASAAYWIGSAAEEIYISGPTVVVGSIGVVATHVEVSKAEEKAGVKTTEITAGKYKRAASRYKELDKFGRDYIQERVDQLYTSFLSAVAKHRGVSIKTVLAKMADGKEFTGEQAIEAGLADGVLTIDELVAKLSARSAGNSNPMSAAGADLLQEPNKMELSEAAGLMTVELLTEHKPELVEEIIGNAASAGAESERTRILAVIEQGKNAPGHDDLIESAIADGKTTGPEVAAKILAAESEQRKSALAQMSNDAPDPVSQPSTDRLADESGDKKRDAIERFNTLVNEKVKEGMTEGEAVSAVAKDNQELHTAYIAAVN